MHLQKNIWKAWFNSKAVFIFVVFIIQVFSSGKLLAQSNSSSNNPTLTGQINAGGNYHNSSNTFPGLPINELNWNVAGNLNLKFKDFNIPFSFNVSEQQRTYTQPFNQFGINPKYKWMNFHVGYCRMNFSPFTISGKTFLGAGIEVKPKNNIRFAALAGRFQKAVNEIQNQPIHTTPAYSRNGMAVKVGYGTETNHIDLILLSAKDDVVSLNPVPSKTDVLPMDNLVMGLSMKTLTSKKFILDAEVAQSKFHRNLLSEESIMQRFAVDATTGLKFTDATLKLNFKRIEPEFQSLGASYINADIQQYTFQPSFKLFKNKMNFNGSVGLQNDNLFNEKSVTTQRLIYSANTSISPGKIYNLNINYSNYGITQQSGTEQLNDTSKISLILSSLNVTNRILITRPKNVQTIVLTNLFQSTNDKNIFTQQYSESNIITTNLTYIFTPLLDGALSWNAGIMGSNIKTNAGNYLNNGFSIGGSKKMYAGKIQTNAQFSFAKTKFSNTDDGSVVNVAADMSYNLSDHHRLLFGFNVIRQTNNHLSVISKYSDNRMNGGYVYTF